MSALKDTVLTGEIDLSKTVNTIAQNVNAVLNRAVQTMNIAEIQRKGITSSKA